MRTARLLTLSRSIPCISGLAVCPIPLDAAPLVDRPGEVCPSTPLGCRAPLANSSECSPVEADPLPLWTEWHTRVKTLPCPKLRLRASSGSSGRVRGGPRNMKSMRPPSAAIFFMTYFHRAGGGHGPLGPPLDPLLRAINIVDLCDK